MRSATAALAAGLPASAWTALAWAPGLGKRLAPFRDKAHKLSALGGMRDCDDLYHALATEWAEGATPGLSASSAETHENRGLGEGVFDPAQRMMLFDGLAYLPDDILVKVDRAAMAASLETRAPLLDVCVAEVASRLPMSMKIRAGVGKWALRQVLYRYVPRELIERPKAGFAIPLGRWLRGPLQDWAEDLLSDKRLRDDAVPRRRRSADVVGRAQFRAPELDRQAVERPDVPGLALVRGVRTPSFVRFGSGVPGCGRSRGVFGTVKS